jgi:putative hydrolase of the HAD superfamily
VEKGEMNRVILIDLGGVLIHVDFYAALSTLASDLKRSKEDLTEIIFSSGLKDLHDSGKISSRQFHAEICPGGEIEFERFKSIWSSIFTENVEVINYMMKLKEKYHICLASNTDPIHFEWCSNRYKWFSSIDRRGVSFRLKALKPDSNFLSRLCSLLNLDFEEAIFIDDSSENVNTASALGIKAHVFQGLQELMSFIE